MTYQPSLPVKIAVALLVIVSLLSIVLTFAPGAPVGGEEGIPVFVVVASAVLGVIGLVVAVFIYQGRTWAKWVAIVITALNGLLAAPGMLFAPTPPAQVSAIFGVISAVAIIVLLLVPAPKTAQMT